jgi:hypothetical protein
LFTNWQDSGRVNKEAAKAFFGSPSVAMFSRGAFADRFDISTRNVYDAFAFDFGAPEQD